MLEIGNLSSVYTMRQYFYRERSKYVSGLWAGFQASPPCRESTVCPQSSDPFYVLTNYIKLVTTSWTHSAIPAKFKAFLLLRLECEELLYLQYVQEVVTHFI